jgi:hypothetical protein
MDQELDQRSRACWHGLAAQSQRQQAVSLQQVAAPARVVLSTLALRQAIAGVVVLTGCASAPPVYDPPPDERKAACDAYAGAAVDEMSTPGDSPVARAAVKTWLASVLGCAAAPPLPAAGASYGVAGTGNVRGQPNDRTAAFAIPAGTAPW